MQAFWKCWGGVPPQQGAREHSSLTGLGETGEAFSCFAEVAHVGPGHQRWPQMWPPPARPPACPS